MAKEMVEIYSRFLFKKTERNRKELTRKLKVLRKREIGVRVTYYEPYFLALGVKRHRRLVRWVVVRHYDYLLSKFWVAHRGKSDVISNIRTIFVH